MSLFLCLNLNLLKFCASVSVSKSVLSAAIYVNSLMIFFGMEYLIAEMAFLFFVAGHFVAYVYC